MYTEASPARHRYSIPVAEKRTTAFIPKAPRDHKPGRDIIFVSFDVLEDLPNELLAEKALRNAEIIRSA